MRDVFLEKLNDPKHGDRMVFLLRYDNGDEEVRPFVYQSNDMWELESPYDSNETRSLVAVNGRDVRERKTDG